MLPISIILNVITLCVIFLSSYLILNNFHISEYQQHLLTAFSIVFNGKLGVLPGDIDLIKSSLPNFKSWNELANRFYYSEFHELFIPKHGVGMGVLFSPFLYGLQNLSGTQSIKYTIPFATIFFNLILLLNLIVNKDLVLKCVFLILFLSPALMYAGWGTPDYFFYILFLNGFYFYLAKKYRIALIFFAFLSFINPIFFPLFLIVLYRFIISKNNSNNLSIYSIYHLLKDYRFSAYVFLIFILAVMYFVVKFIYGGSLATPNYDLKFDIQNFFYGLTYFFHPNYGLVYFAIPQVVLIFYAFFKAHLSGNFKIVSNYILFILYSIAFIYIVSIYGSMNIKMPYQIGFSRYAIVYLVWFIGFLIIFDNFKSIKFKYLIVIFVLSALNFVSIYIFKDKFENRSLNPVTEFALKNDLLPNLYVEMVFYIINPLRLDFITYNYSYFDGNIIFYSGDRSFIPPPMRNAFVNKKWVGNYEPILNNTSVSKAVDLGQINYKCPNISIDNIFIHKRKINLIDFHFNDRSEVKFSNPYSMINGDKVVYQNFWNKVSYSYVFDKPYNLQAEASFFEIYKDIIKNNISEVYLPRAGSDCKIKVDIKN